MAIPEKIKIKITVNLILVTLEDEESVWYSGNKDISIPVIIVENYIIFIDFLDLLIYNHFSIVDFSHKIQPQAPYF